MKTTSVNFIDLNATGMTEAAVDDVIASADTAPAWAGSKALNLDGAGNAPPSAAAAAAIASLQGKGVTVTTN